VLPANTTVHVTRLLILKNVLILDALWKMSAMKWQELKMDTYHQAMANENRYR
jgi:hypothetical protein